MSRTSFYEGDGQVAEEARERCHLANVLGSVSNCDFGGSSEYFKLTGTLQSAAQLCGATEVSTKRIQYSLEPRGSGNIARAGCTVTRIADNFRVAEELQRDVTYLSTRNTALPKSFHSMSLSAIVERLARGMAQYSVFGTLTPVQLRGGGAVNIYGLSAASDNIAVGPANVFISKRETDRRFPATECALYNAVTGEGGTIFTDLLSLDGNGTAQVPIYNDGDLARGCYSALCQLGRVMNSSGAGPSFALAVFRGVTKNLTVVSHTDEGGYVRKVMRAGAYEAPYGAIVLSQDTGAYTGLPTPGGGRLSFRRLVFSIAIGGAAGSVCSDPMTTLDGIDYPTLLVDDLGGLDDAGVEPAGLTDTQLTDQGERMRSKFYAGCGGWAENYVYFLTVLHGCSGSLQAATAVISAAAEIAIDQDDAHLQRHMAVAYAWIEPTSVVPFWDTHLPAFAADCGPLAVTHMPRTVPAMRDTAVEEELGGDRYSVLTRLAYPRRHGLLVHLTENSRNGMGDIRLFSGTSSHFANVGGAGAMDGRIMAGNALSTYAWGRLHNLLPSVGEFMEVNPVLRLVFERGRVPANDQFGWVPGHVPAPEEICGDIRYCVSRPTMREGTAALGTFNRSWSRSRTAAARALVMASNRLTQPSGWGGNVRPMLGVPMYSA